MRTAVKLGVWHAARHAWWYENDSNSAKVVTRCGLRQDNIDTAHGAPEDEAWCARCFPDGKPVYVIIKTPDQLRALSL